MLLKNLCNYFFRPIKHFAIFELDRRYRLKEYSDRGMYYLGSFFTDDVGSRAEDWIIFLDDPEDDDCYTGDSFVLQKLDNGNVRVFAEYHERSYAPYPIPDSCTKLIKSSELRKLLCQWQELRSRDPRPPKIKITEKCGIFNMEAVG